MDEEPLGRRIWATVLTGMPFAIFKLGAGVYLHTHVSEAAGVVLPTGVAGYWTGPSFETPAEIRLAQLAGCSISSNSFLPEVMAGYHAGMQVLAFTFVSTMSAGIGPAIDLGPVLEVTRRAHTDYRTILRAAIPVLAQAAPRG